MSQENTRVEVPNKEVLGGIGRCGLSLKFLVYGLAGGLWLEAFRLRDEYFKYPRVSCDCLVCGKKGTWT